MAFVGRLKCPMCGGDFRVGIAGRRRPTHKDLFEVICPINGSRFRFRADATGPPLDEVSILPADAAIATCWTYYRTDTTRLTFQELWRISSRLPVFLSACLKKIFGLRGPARWAVQHEDSIIVLKPEELPGPCLTALIPLVDEFEQLGARMAFYHTVPALGNLESYAAVLLCAENNGFIVVVWTRAWISQPGKETCACVVTSQLQDGTFFSTTDRPRTFNEPPEFRIGRYRRATPTELAERHQQALRQSELSPVPIRDAEKAKQVLLAGRRRLYEWHVQRGVYVPLTAEELDSLVGREEDGA
jgi:hypothetical protein